MIRRKFKGLVYEREQNYMYLFRAIWVWILIIIAESVHGTLRQLFLAPLIGDFPARRLAFFTGLVIIFGITWLCIRWIEFPDKKSLLRIGLIWTVLTVLFEVGLGIFVLGYSPARILEDYNIFHGGLMGFGLLFMFFVPLMVAGLRGETGIRSDAWKDRGKYRPSPHYRGGRPAN